MFVQFEVRSLNRGRVNPSTQPGQSWQTVPPMVGWKMTSGQQNALHATPAVAAKKDSAAHCAAKEFGRLGGHDGFGQNPVREINRTTQSYMEVLPMKRLALVILVVLASFSVAMAQDVLGAHNGYGRGCVMCHAPHSGSGGNGVIKGDATSGNYALWGQDLTPLYGQTLKFGDGGNFVVTLPAAGTITSAHDANTVILFCLSCHDGNLAKVGMMKGSTVETLPIVGGNAPTLLGN